MKRGEELVFLRNGAYKRTPGDQAELVVPTAAGAEAGDEVDDEEGEGDDNLEDAKDDEPSAGVDEPGGGVFGFGHC